MTTIGIDARKAADFGIGRYIERLVNGLAGLDSGALSFCLFGGEKALEICRRATGGDPRFTLLNEPSQSYSLGEHLSLPLALRRAEVALYHSTHYVLPHGPLPRRVVTSVHDLIHLIYPGYLPSRAALLYARHFIGRAARRSDAVITGSLASRDDLLRFYPRTDPHKVRVIPYGVDGRFRPWSSAAEEDAEREELRGLGLGGRYLLYVGNFKPHKNLATVLEAYAGCQRQDPETPPLALVGRDLSAQGELERLAAGLPDPSRLIGLGRQPDRLLPALYRGATLFLFLSRYEGFGLPPLEALACGTPVLASRGGSLPEVLGDAAAFTDHEDAGPITRAILSLVNDPRAADRARRLGPRQAGRFRWTETAERTLALYRSLL